MIQTSDFGCMGTSFHVEAENVKELEDWFKGVEQRYSRFIRESELSKINALDPSDNWINISNEFYHILQVVSLYHERTNSLFNPYLGKQLKGLGYNRSFQDIDGEDWMVRAPSYQRKGVLIHPLLPKIKKLKSVEIDLGGFVKGWSVDKAYKIAKGEWIYLDAGGDMRFLFQKYENIGVLNPCDPASDIAIMTLRQGAVATSSTVFRRWTTNEGERHHILGGRTGENARSNVIQATVLTDKVQESEVYAKVMCMRNATESIQWLKSHCPKAAAILITDEKKIFLTNNITNYCKGVKIAWGSQLGNGPEFQG